MLDSFAWNVQPPPAPPAPFSSSAGGGGARGRDATTTCAAGRSKIPTSLPVDGGLEDEDEDGVADEDVETLQMSCHP